MSKKFPCALLINDIHASKDNIAEFRKNWDEALELCKQNKVQYLIVGGDMWLSRSAQTLDVLMAVRWAILKATKQFGLYLIIAEGNHCKVNLENIEGYSHVFSDYENVEVINDFTEVTLADEVSLWVMSYFPENGSFIDKLDVIKSCCRAKKNVLYIHQGIRGGLAAPSDDELPAHIFNEFDSVLVGHYHNRKQIHGTNIEYIGSSRQHNFGEDEEKGYTILYSDGSTQFIKNEVNQRYKVIEVDVADMDDDFMNLLAEIKADSRYKVKVRVNCKSAQSSAINKQKLAEAGANKIELVTEQTEVMRTDHKSLTQKFDKSGIKEEYTNFCVQKSIDNQLGLHYLEKLN
ncbi:phosphoesterase [Phocaeicola vulgatus]|uniref:metallophosphoesterase family protein n=1 Tax=Phocaeicola vulgatus TaxID=821 RepID=UPI000E4BF46B|nr:phosphoesterase [Phocaeicola vulgatus]RHM93005.1 phosphoesterase [Phocaeicola vulgatus]